MTIKVLLLSVILSIFFVFIYADEIEYATFGGHVKWKHSEDIVKEVAPSLRIHLYSLPQKTLRQVFPVLPNGAYSVAVATNGHYRLQLSVPNGWNYEPADGYDIHINDKHKDQGNYVFYLTGFDVTGQVVTTGMTTGPPNLVVSVLSGTAEPSKLSIVVGQTKTSANGSFVLTSITPGKFLLTISDSSTIASSEDVRASTQITVSKNSLNLVQPLVLQGHILRSSISFSGVGLPHISVLLFASQTNKLTPSNIQQLGCVKPASDFTDLLPIELRALTPVCQTATDAEGMFSFSRLAGGDYFLFAYHRLTKTSEIKAKLNILPQFIPVKMEHTDLLLSKGFQVASFRVTGGSVNLPSSDPIAFAKILLDGVVITESDSKGGYAVDVHSSGEHVIEANFPKLRFHSSKVNFSPKSQNLPRFIPSEVEVCGRLISATSVNFVAQNLPKIEFTSNSNFKHTINPTISKENKTIVATFCAYLPLEIVNIKLLKSAISVRFSPSSLSIDLSGGPVKDLVFTQFQAQINGEIVCLVKCPISKTLDSLGLAIRLTPLFESSDVASSLTLLTQNPKNNKRATYSIDSVLPGSYNIELVWLTVIHQPVIAIGWCWASLSSTDILSSASRPIVVVDANLDTTNSPNLRFVHSGFQINAEAPILDTNFNQPISLIITPFAVNTDATNSTFSQTKQSFQYKLINPLSKLCLGKNIQRYTVRAETACLRLDVPTPSVIDTALQTPGPTPTMIRLNVKQLPVQVTVSVSDAFVSQFAKLKLPHLIIEAAVKTNLNTSIIQLPAKWILTDKYSAKTSLWAEPGSEVVFSVKPVSGEKADIYPLIVPSSSVLKVHESFELVKSHYDLVEVDHLENVQTKPMSTDDCLITLKQTFENLSVFFTMQPGFFYTGLITPAVSKVIVKVFADSQLVSSLTPASDINKSEEPENSHLSLVAEAITNSDGVFKIGPFYFNPQKDQSNVTPPTDLLTLQVTKHGYEFVKKEGNVLPSSTHQWYFTSRKLALVELTISTENGTYLPNTLITVIGSSFRGSKTTDSAGMVHFIGLLPGEYYLQPMLKEYDFFVRDGNSLLPIMQFAISVVDGSTVTTQIIGKRIAFSAFGKVTSLSGLPESELLIEAQLVVDETCELQLQVGNIDVTIEQAITDINGQFKIYGLVPGCLYNVSVRKREAANPNEYYFQSKLSSLRTVPGQIFVRTENADMHNLHFYLIPQVNMEMVTATVDAAESILSSLSIAIYPTDRADRELVRHKFATGSRFFSLSGKQIQPMIGNSYYIVLETNFNVLSRGHNATVQKFHFTMKPAFSKHFNFAYFPKSPSSQL